MAIDLFGFRLGKPETKKTIQSFTPPPNEDGAVSVNEQGIAGVFGNSVINLDNTAKNEAQLITKYREMAGVPECERAIDDVINEAVIIDSADSTNSVDVVLDNIEQLSDSVKDKIRDEFEYILSLMDFNRRGYDIFKKWYVDGRIYYNIMIDSAKPNDGIKELRNVDPRKIKKVRSKRSKTGKNLQDGNNILAKEYNEYYIYSPKGVTSGQKAVKIATDAIAHCHSGLMDAKNTMVLSHLHKAMKTLNQLSELEDAVVIYRLARAPERRIFYLDVGNMTKQKAEQYLREMMQKHKNKLHYDPATGEVKDGRRHMTMMEDYWLPRREGGTGTEIDTLPGGDNLGEMDDVLYYQKKLYMALSVPVSRLESDASFNIGRASEISRDELKFSRFVDRLRIRFSELFHDILGKQLMLKGIMNKKEWDRIQNEINYNFKEDNHFTELKEAEILQNRVETLNSMEDLIGKYFSREWAQKNVLRQSEKEIDDMKKQMDAERKEEEAREDSNDDDDKDGFG